MKRKHLLPLLLWTLIWGLFFATLLLAVERLPTGDFSGQFHAFVNFQAREMAAGRLPLWAPGSYGGIPFAADTQAAVFYPLRWLAILFSLPIGFSYYLLELEGLLHIWLAGVFTYFLVFDITRDRAADANARHRALAGFLPEQWAGLIAAVTFGLGGYLTSYPLLQLAVLESIVWLPLVLYLLRRAVRSYDNAPSPESSPVPTLLAAGIVLGVSALAGHPQTFLHVAYLSAAYYIFLTWQARWRWSWILGLGILIGVAALGIAAAAFIPAIRFVPLTVRGDVSYEFVSKGLPLLHALQILLPAYLSQWLPQYAGLAAIALAIIAWLGRKSWKESRQRAETVFWIVAIVLAAWLALGDKGILFELVYRAAPGFSLFRQQERLVSLFVLGVAILAGQGFVIWARADAMQRRLLVRRTIIILAALLLLVGFIQLLSRTAVGENDWLLIWIRQWMILALIFVILWPFDAGSNTKWDQWRGLVLLVLLSLDLFFPVRRAMNLVQESPNVFWPQPSWLESLTGDEITRIDGQNLFHANLGVLHGLEDIKGISPLKPQLVADMEDLPRPLRWQLLNVKHVLAERPIEEGLTQLEEIKESIFPGQEANAYVYRFEDSLPRAWMVYDAAVAADDGSAYDLIRQPGFDPVTQVILTNPAEPYWEGIAVPDQPPDVDIARLSSSDLVFNIETETGGILVISEWALPGWQVTLDGVEVPLLTADYGLHGLFIPPGTHEALLTYVGQDAKFGLLLFLLTLGGALILAWRWRPIVPTRSISRNKVEPVDKHGGEHVWKDNLSSVQFRWIMVGILLLGFGLRLFLIGNQELRGDEAFSYIYSQLPLGEVIPELIKEGDPHTPLHYLLLNGWVDLAGVSELSMRWLSLLPGFLLIPVLYQLGREMAGRRTGLLTAFLAAFSPSLIWLSQDVRNQYNLAILFTSLATWLLVEISEAAADRSRMRNAGFWVVYALLAAAAIYSHYYAIFALLAHGLYLWFVPERRRIVWPWIAAGLLAVLFFLPWFTAGLAELLDAGQLSDPGTPDLARYLVKVGRELIIGGTLPGRWTRWLFLGITALVLAGFFVLRRKKPGWAAMLMGWLGGALLVIFLIQFSRSTFNAFYLSAAAPAWLLLLAVGLLTLWQHGGWRRVVAVAALIALLGSTIASLRNYYFDPNHSRTLGYREIADVLQEEVEDGDVFVAHFPDPSFVYYLRDIDIARQLAPSKAGLSAQEIEAELSRLAHENPRLWLVPYHRSVWDPQDVVPQWLARHTLLEQVEDRQRLTAELYRPLHSAGEIMEPVGLSTPDHLKLEGAFVKMNGRAVDLDQPLDLIPGSNIQISLLWSAENEISRSYTVFVHLLNENGILIAQHDGVPDQGQRPTNSWQTGEQLIDTHEIVLPDDGQGVERILVGLYDSETLERQLFSNGDNAIELTNR